MMMTMPYHSAALPGESLAWLNLKPGGTYVDATLGGGGHSRLILEALEGGLLYGLDQDPAAAANAPTDERFTLLQGNFRHLRRLLRLHGVSQVDGLLADFGVSSHQFDAAERGFSLRHDAPLDMRMNPDKPLTAAQLLNEYPEAELRRIFKQFGEISQAGRLARTVVMARPLETTAQLKEAALTLAPRQREHRFLAQVFQAIRIVVNEELSAIEEWLQQVPSLLKPGGRVVCLSYHSLEDRLVKNFFRYGNTEGQPQKDFYGNLQRPLKPLTRKPIFPQDQEIEDNPRARSARLRAAQKVPEDDR